MTEHQILTLVQGLASVLEQKVVKVIMGFLEFDGSSRTRRCYREPYKTSRLSTENFDEQQVKIPVTDEVEWEAAQDKQHKSPPVCGSEMPQLISSPL